MVRETCLGVAHSLARCLLPEHWGFVFFQLEMKFMSLHCLSSFLGASSCCALLAMMMGRGAESRHNLSCPMLGIGLWCVPPCLRAALHKQGALGHVGVLVVTRGQAVMPRWALGSGANPESQ